MENTDKDSEIDELKAKIERLNFLIDGQRQTIETLRSNLAAYEDSETTIE